jgi:hypothetical protein
MLLISGYLRQYYWLRLVSLNGEISHGIEKIMKTSAHELKNEFYKIQEVQSMMFQIKDVRIHVLISMHVFLAFSIIGYGFILFMQQDHDPKPDDLIFHTKNH